MSDMINSQAPIMNKIKEQDSVLQELSSEMIAGLYDIKNAIMENNKEFIKEIANMNQSSSAKDELIKSTVERRLEFEKNQLEKDNEELLRRFENEKQVSNNIFSKMGKNLSDFISDDSKGSKTKETLQSNLLGPLNVAFAPIKDALDDMGIDVFGWMKKKDEEEEDPKDNEDYIRLKNELDITAENRLREIEDGFLSKLGTTLSNTPYVQAQTDILEESHEHDLEVKEETDEHNEEMLNHLDSLNRNTLEGNKEAKKSRGMGGITGMVLSILPMLIAAGASINWKGAFSDIGQALYNMTIGKIVEPIKQFFADMKDWLSSFIDKLTPEFLKSKPEKRAKNIEKDIEKEKQKFEKEKEKISGKEIKSGDAFGRGRFTEEDKLKELQTLEDRYDKRISNLSEALSKLRGNEVIGGLIPDETIEDGIIYKDGKIIKTSQDDNIFATKNEIFNTSNFDSNMSKESDNIFTKGFDSNTVTTQSKEVTPDMSLEIRDLLVKQNELLMRLNNTLENKEFTADIVGGEPVKKPKKVNLESIRNIGG